MLEPKKIKYRRHHRGNRRGMASRGNYVAFGTYGAIAVDLANGSSGYNILGVYGGTVQTGFIDADSIVISADNYAITDLNFVADFSYINSGSH